MMKNFLLSILLIFILGNLCHFGLPWWSVAPIAAIVMFVLPQKGFSAFGAGFLGGFLLWGINALVLHTANGGMFAAKIGQIFQGVSSSNLLYVTSLMGGLLGGFGALTGKFANDFRAKPQRRNYYTPRKRSGKYR